MRGNQYLIGGGLDCSSPADQLNGGATLLKHGVPIAYPGTAPHIRSYRELHPTNQILMAYPKGRLNNIKVMENSFNSNSKTGFIHCFVMQQHYRVSESMAYTLTCSFYCGYVFIRKVVLEYVHITFAMERGNVVLGSHSLQCNIWLHKKILHIKHTLTTTKYFKPIPPRITVFLLPWPHCRLCTSLHADEASRPN